MPVAIYKTNVTSQVKVKKLKPLLNALLSTAQWNFDLDDRDRILRVESKKDFSNVVIEALCKAGFECVEIF